MAYEAAIDNQSHTVDLFFFLFGGGGARVAVLDLSCGTQAFLVVVHGLSCPWHVAQAHGILVP